MKSLKLKENFYWVGAIDADLRVFDIIMETKYGTTYNSYLLESDQGVVLFESVKERYFNDYLNKINEICSVDKIKYVICNHTEPDHSGSLALLIEKNPNIIVVSSMLANKYLKDIINHDFKSLIVKDNDVLDLGNKKIRFISVPNLHWPDSMYSYIEEDKVLLTCDSFGAHYALENILLSKVDDRKAYNEAFSYYSTMIMGPFKPFVAKGMEKIIHLDISLIAPGHGPIIDEEMDDMIQKYIEFSKEEEKTHKKIVIPYVSAYGYTKLMAETIKEVIEENKIECHIYDLVESDMDEVVKDMQEADGILYGSPTLLQDALSPIYTAMNSILAAYHGRKIASAFGSYGWSGEAVPNLIARLKQQKMKVNDEGLKICFKANDAELNEVRVYAKHFIEQL